MTISLRSFAKINLGLYIGPLRADGFHELRTVYQTIELHDRLTVRVTKGEGIEILCTDERVPKDASNTCWRIAERTMAALDAKGRVVVEIQKRLPVQGGVGGASGNAVATLLGIERALKKQLPGAERLKIAAAVGSDLPLFLVGGTALGVEHGECVYPLPDFPAVDCVVAFPEIGVSTPGAFADWDLRIAPKLTAGDPSARMNEFGRTISAWLSGSTGSSSVGMSRTGSNRSRPVSGAPAWGGGRVGNPLLSLVQAGIANDFEKVAFPQHPELHEVKSVLEQAGAKYASLSGSGAAVYGLFWSRASAAKAVLALKKRGVRALATKTLTRREYWKKLWAR
jgi:4-diphosphocytidyl-2-C-methyl-D-erythritol kinase